MPNLQSLELGLQPVNFFSVESKSFVTKDRLPFASNIPPRNEFFVCDLDISEYHHQVTNLGVDVTLLSTLFGTPKQLLAVHMRPPLHSPSFACTRLFLNVPSSQNAYVRPLLEIVPNVTELHVTGGVLDDPHAFASMSVALKGFHLQKFSIMEPATLCAMYHLPSLLSSLPVSSLHLCMKDVQIEPSLIPPDTNISIFELSLTSPAPRTIERLPRNVQKLGITNIVDGVVSEIPPCCREVYLGIRSDHSISRLPHNAQWDTFVVTGDPSSLTPLPFIQELPHCLYSLVLCDVEVLNHTLFEVADCCPYLGFLSIRQCCDVQHNLFGGIIACVSNIKTLKYLELDNAVICQTSLATSPYPSSELRMLKDLSFNQCHGSFSLLEALLPLCTALSDLYLVNCTDDALSGIIGTLLLQQPLVRIVLKGFKHHSSINMPAFVGSVVKKCEFVDIVPLD
ncbi:hypothetical protein P9112_002775 [Eukaryota sp. TZLM1-RC]